MKRVEASHLRLGHGTHPGETGKNNEDHYGLATFRSDDGQETVTLGVVADGIGGRRAGEVASEMIVSTVVEAVGRHADRNYQAALELAFVQAAITIVEAAQANSDHYGMGSTCVAALIAGRRLYTAYIGDSRAYLIRNQTIRQTSVDHTWIQEAIEAGVITREEAKHHPHQHVVRRHLGKDPNVKPDFRLRLHETEPASRAEKNQGLLLEPGDAVVLCTDGLSDLVEADEIRDRVLQREPQAAVDGLIQLARERGGHDNITVIVMQVPR